MGFDIKKVFWKVGIDTQQHLVSLLRFTNFKDIDQMLSGYYALIQTDHSFLLGTLDLPDPLAADFRLARDLFSTGFDEIGLLVAGRGLEGVLRKIAAARKISLQTKKTAPASEADSYDLIEVMYRVKWKLTGVSLISQETKALL